MKIVMPTLEMRMREGAKNVSNDYLKRSHLQASFFYDYLKRAITQHKVSLIYEFHSLVWCKSNCNETT
jgi:hypothetical protein